MRISWDDKKEAANIAKHGVDFSEAMTVLLNPDTLMNVNDHPNGDRMEYLGFSENARMLYVVTVEQNQNEARIISARKATAKERSEYGKRV